ncbi:hypothetical protein AgCh_035192 [Apium graveolens]
MSVNVVAAAAAYKDSVTTSIITNLVTSHFPINPSTISCCCFSPGRNNNYKLVQTNYSTSSSVSPSLVVIDEQAATSQLPPPVSPCPRRLILLRHAHSSYPNASLRDHDRPLSESGEADAIKVSQKLHQLGWVPGLILSSDALRTRETLKCMQDKVKELSEAEVHFISSFYSIAAMDGQTAQHLQQAICKYARDETLTVMCMGHNRGWEEAASVLSGASIELKTCNAALLEASGNSWEEVNTIMIFL